ncbi:MAG: zinc ABC transporter substrate-binding protein [Thiomicrorhabdus sp.]|nr:zinc ABC transporter substrate-binding protein [Thiomicrorhabdus sp.]
MLFVLLLSGLLFAGTSSVLAVTVTVSIPPLAGVIAPLLGERDQLNVLLKPGVSPHGFQLRPSHLRTLQSSDLVLFVGGGMDAWIEKPVQSMSKPHIEMMALPNLIQLSVREGGLWEPSPHERGRHTSHRHAHNETDNHIWLSPLNAALMIKAVSLRLQALMPAQAQAIRIREKNWLLTLSATDAQVSRLLAPIKNQPFLVLHDAFQYFEAHYGLNGAGAIRLNPELPPSLKRIHQLREQIKAGNVRCIFKEPQFSEKRLQAVTSGLSVRIGVLDPMGGGILQGNKGSLTDYVRYDAFLKQMAHALLECW